jgi:hypothetical protein
MRGGKRFTDAHAPSVESAIRNPNSAIPLNVHRRKRMPEQWRSLSAMAGGNGRHFGTRPPSWVRNIWGIVTTGPNLPTNLLAPSRISNFVRLYGLRAESPRSARAALLQAAPYSLQPACRDAAAIVAASFTLKVIVYGAVRFRPGAAKVNVTGQFEERRAE